MRRLVMTAFDHVGLDPAEHVQIDESPCARPRWSTWSATRRKRSRSWLEPRTSFEDLVRLMVDADLELLARGVSQQAG